MPALSQEHHLVMRTGRALRMPLQTMRRSQGYGHGAGLLFAYWAVPPAGTGARQVFVPDRVSRSVISAAFAASLDCHGRLPRSEVLTTSAL